jgi:HK97 family phage major capsid protein
MPDVAGSAKPIAFGDFSRAYTVVDRVNLSIMRDPYSQATSGNIRYVARRRVGGQVVLAEAIQLQNISA